MNNLLEYLLDAYNVPLSQRHRALDQDQLIKIDDENSGDVSYLFCQIHARLPDPHGKEIILTFDKAPFGLAARELIIERDGTIEETWLGPIVTLPIDIKSISFLRKLARTVRNTVGHNRSYADPNWKWLCPRTATSLEQFADIVMAYRSKRRAELQINDSHARHRAVGDQATGFGTSCFEG